MKKHLLLLVALIIATSASAQYYVSASAGLSIGSAGILTGTSLNSDYSVAKNHYGSYGEGINGQIKAGYFFNDMFGAEIGLAYLHGSDQNISYYKTNKSDAGVTSISEYTEGTGHGRAYGFTAALVYNFNENVYGKIGAITKVGGKTEAEFNRTTPTPLSAYGIAPILSEGKADYHGRIPLGFTATFGYKFNLNDNLNLFAEIEYLGINVTRDNSEYTELTITTPAIPAGVVGASAVPSMVWNLGDAPMAHPVFGTIAAPTEIEYVDSLDPLNTDSSKSLSSTVPYSSIGINFGITYTFNKK